MRIAFDNSYARLPERFYARVLPAPVAAPRLVALNQALAAELGLDVARLASPEGAEILAGVRIAEGSEPLAQAYAGHQFGQFVPQLGDGRALLLGEVVGRDGERRDIQLKGSGPTPFSRRGDGRAALGPVLREYIVSEAMHALRIPTTRTLAAVTTGEPVYREAVLPGAVLTRVAASHVRVGTFQYFAARGDGEALRLLAGHVIARHYPEAAHAANPALALLEAVAARQARLVARWLGVGFIHGVMNTDNCQIAGETIDYGPCAFMDAYDPATVYSSIDHFGRYAYANQPKIAQWNMARFAECLLPLIGENQDEAVAAANEVVGGFAAVFERAYAETFAAKIGLVEVRDGDLDIVRALLKAMHDTGADFTLTFRALAEAVTGDVTPAAAQFGGAAAFETWLAAWRARLDAQGAAPAAVRTAMRGVSPAFIPRNHRVEQALTAASAGDLEPFRRLTAILARPFEDQPENAAYMQPPAPGERVEATFCGT